MGKTEDRKLVENLRKELNYHNYCYHVLDNPVINDSDFDHMMRQLINLENCNPDLISPDSPTQRVGSPPADGFQRVAHPKPMLSLANVFNYEELDAWYQRISRLLGKDSFEIVCELKIDGLAVELTYEDGVLVRGTTRGDGFYGLKIANDSTTIQNRLGDDSGYVFLDYLAIYGTETVIVLDSFRIGNIIPRIVSISAPDTIVRPSDATVSLHLISAEVFDADGLQTIKMVGFTSYHVDGLILVYS